MAEHMNQPDPEAPTEFNALGHPVPFERMEACMTHAKDMGLSSGEAYDLTRRMVAAVERDKPFEAQKIAMQYLDLTAFYRLFAVLLTDPSPLETEEKAQETPQRAGDAHPGVFSALRAAVDAIPPSKAPDSPADDHVEVAALRAALDVANAERDEADRRAGAAEREVSHLNKVARSRDDWLYRAKQSRGYESHVSFDVVWQEVCEKADLAAREDRAKKEPSK